MLQLKLNYYYFTKLQYMIKYGYARVSSSSQEYNYSLENQQKSLMNEGVLRENIRIEVASGANEIRNRPVLKQLINQELNTGDMLIVTKLDRCSRNTLEFLKLQDFLFKRHIVFVALDLPNSNDLATNKLIATTLSAIATFENDRRKERQMEGILAAKKIGGKYKGRKSVITQQLISRVEVLKARNLTILEIAKLLGVSRPTIYKVLKNKLGYVSNRLVKPDQDNSNNGDNGDKTNESK